METTDNSVRQKQNKKKSMDKDAKSHSSLKKNLPQVRPVQDHFDKSVRHRSLLGPNDDLRVGVVPPALGGPDQGALPRLFKPADDLCQRALCRSLEVLRSMFRVAGIEIKRSSTKGPAIAVAVYKLFGDRGRGFYCGFMAEGTLADRKHNRSSLVVGHNEGTPRRARPASTRKKP